MRPYVKSGVAVGASVTTAATAYLARRVFTDDTDRLGPQRLRMGGIPIAVAPYTSAVVTGGDVRNGDLYAARITAEPWPVRRARRNRLVRALAPLRHGPLRRVIPEDHGPSSVSLIENQIWNSPPTEIRIAEPT